MNLPVVSQDLAPALPDRALPTLSTEVTEKFWTEGQDALQDQSAQVETFLKDSGLTCCVGVDMPERGHVHSHDCPAVALRAHLERPTAVRGGAMRHEPATEEADKRERLLCALLFAANELANAQIMPRLADRYDALCEECAATDRHSHGMIAHHATCKTGRVLRILADLTSAGNLNRKEAATEGTTDQAEDGIPPLEVKPMRIIRRPNVLYGEPWQVRHERTLGVLWIYDAQGTRIATIPKADREAQDWAERIVLCVNAMGGCEVSQ